MSDTNPKEREECCGCGIHYFKGKEILDYIYCPECKKSFLKETEQCTKKHELLVVKCRNCKTVFVKGEDEQ